MQQKSMYGSKLRTMREVRDEDLIESIEIFKEIFKEIFMEIL